MHGGLLVTDVDDPDALVDAAVVERHDVAAGKREDALDAGLLERARRELATVEGHGDTSMRIGHPTVSPARRAGQITRKTGEVCPASAGHTSRKADA